MDINSEEYCKYVSSRGLLKSCDIYSSTPISGISTMINYNNFNKNMYRPIIYVCISSLNYFIKNVFENIQYEFILLTGDNDETCPYDLLSEAEFTKFIESNKLIHWFSQNCILTNHPKLSQMPIGLDYHTMSVNDHSWGKKTTPIDQEKILENIKTRSLPFHKRINKAYSNFHFFMTTKFGYDRKDAVDKINEDLVYYEPEKVEREKSWETQSKYAFVISPHGNGLDCHRTWEALCLGCIPIVKTSMLDPLYKDLPVLIVNDWSLVTQDLLDDTIEKFKNIDFNYNKLTLSYWMDKIKSYKSHNTSNNNLNGEFSSNNIMKQYNVVVTGCCRNVSYFIEKNVFIMNELGKKFKDYKIVIYENDSNDNTRQILKSFKNERIDFIFEDNVNIPNRTMRIAHCRNKILDHVNNLYSNYDYLLMLDLDDVLFTGKLIDTLDTCFLYKTEQWDAMFANCSDKYYDIYALRKKKYLMSCCWNNANILQQKGMSRAMAYNECIDKYIIHYPTDTKLMPVVSAFGGAGLYKLKSLKNIRYNGYEESHLDKQVCEHVPLNTKLYEKGCKLYINPKMLIR